MLSSIVALAAAAAATAAPAIHTPPPLALQNLFGQPQTWGTQHPFVLNLVQALFIVSAIGLIGLMSAQTTKTEGLSGSIGGRMESAYHGRLGIEQQIGRLTNTFAVVFIILAIVFFFITR